ncbi:DnaT-like ssDNA-binding domain-containing protein [Yersinia kristensenii]|uniref:HNH endonuclease n=1 Tax=Yersinia kristensenii TaxID=28152 RepID=A0AB73PLD7_YERKR|nr:DnaT-like ssDNA-binding domain-containing protein [Yersinia kristensenii]OVZ82208.1 hypothetical protein CBW52_05205 [Yersinia kristensenii]
MARIRTIKPEFWTDSMMVQFDVFTRLLYIGLWTAADDHGAIRDEPDRIAMEVMPREDIEMVKLNIDLLIASGRLSRMLNDDGTSYLIIDKWTDHQRVDKPSKSKIIREHSRKLAIPAESRRKVALKYGCTPGDKHEATCYFCGNPGSIYWPRLYSGKTGSWVAFSELELDHFEPESTGGKNSSENLVLSCRNCNRARCNKTAFDFVTAKLSANPRESSGEFMGGKEGKGREGNGKENPSLCAREISGDSDGENTGPDPGVVNSILDNRAPPAGGLGNFGKFVMAEGWKPETGFCRKAATWGVIISDFTPVELAEFVTYWQSEGKAFHQAQWEQKFAQSIKHVRNKKSGGTDGQKAPAAASGESRAVQTIKAAIAADRARNGIQPVGTDGGSVFGSLGDEEWIGTVLDMEDGSIET